MHVTRCTHGGQRITSRVSSPELTSMRVLGTSGNARIGSEPPDQLTVLS